MALIPVGNGCQRRLEGEINYSLSNLRDKCHISREGVSMLGISDAAEKEGLLHDPCAAAGDLAMKGSNTAKK